MLSVDLSDRVCRWVCYTSKQKTETDGSVMGFQGGGPRGRPVIWMRLKIGDPKIIWKWFDRNLGDHMDFLLASNFGTHP